MSLLTFKGGVHPNDGKALAKDKAIVQVQPKGDLVYPMSQHIGAPAVPIVAKGDHVLADQSKGNCQTDSSGGIQMRRDRKHGSHDAADDCVWRLSAANRHVTDGHQLVSTANDQTGGEIAQDRTDDSTGNDRLVQGFQEIKLVDGHDKDPHKDQNDLKCTKAHNKYSFSSI